jgi:hypothetical protein
MIKSRMMRWVGNVLDIGAMRKAYRILVRRHERKTSLGRPTYSLEYDIKVDLKQTWCGLSSSLRVGSRCILVRAQQ